jgi:hypothetical protein
MFKRIKRLIELSKKEPKALEALESLTPEQLKEVPDVSDTEEKGEFFPLASEADFVEFERKQKGMDKWYNRIKNL